MAKLNFASTRLAGYYYDSAEDRIYSTKRGLARAIAWSSTRSNGDLYARLTDVAGNRFRVLKKDIHLYVERESNNGSQQMVTPQQKSSNDSYIVVDISGSTLRPGENPKVHSTEAAARAEAERLAREHHNLKFRVFKDCGTVQAQDIVWS